MEQLEPRATPSADVIQNMVEEIMEQAPHEMPKVATYLGLLKTDGSFSDLTYRGNSDKSAEHLQWHGERLEVLSLALKWNDANNVHFSDPTLKASILKGWSYLASKGGSVSAPNWWWKEIGTPQGMSDGLVLMHQEIPASVRTQILSKYFGKVWNPSKMTAANLAYQAPLAMIDGLLRGNAGRIRDVVSKVSSELTGYSGEGIQRDLSFLQHRTGGKLHFHNGSYGMIWASDVSRVMRWVGETSYAFKSNVVAEQAKFLVDGQAWLTRGDTFDIPSQGRSVQWAHLPTRWPFILRNAMEDLVPLGQRTDALLAAVDRYDNGVSETNALSGNKQFWNGDTSAHHRPRFMTTVRMLSSRTPRPETAAGANTKGFFEGDGFTMIVKDGDEFRTPGGPEIFRAWDWQRLPGTTVEQNGVIPYTDMFKSSSNAFGASTLVGSASDGEYGLAAMDYMRSGVTVTAKKAWFFFDDEFIALGADIDSSSTKAPVFTSLNQVILDGAVTVKDAVGRRTLSLGDSASLSGGSWIEHDGIGYVMLDATNRTTVQAKFQSGTFGAVPIFSAWVDHGVRPQNATYAYAVVPNVSADDVNSYAENLPVQILANTSNLQAVHHLGLNQTQAAFYAAGTLQLAGGMTISVDRAANLIARREGNNLTITAADPRQSSSPLTITVNGTRLVVPLPAGAYAGSSVTRTLTLPPSASPGDSTLLHDLVLIDLDPPQLPVTPAPEYKPANPVATTQFIWNSTAKASSAQRLAQGHGGPLDLGAVDSIWGAMGLSS